MFKGSPIKRPAYTQALHKTINIPLSVKNLTTAERALRRITEKVGTSTFLAIKSVLFNSCEACLN